MASMRFLFSLIVGISSMLSSWRICHFDICFSQSWFWTIHSNSDYVYEYRIVLALREYAHNELNISTHYGRTMIRPYGLSIAHFLMACQRHISNTNAHTHTPQHKLPIILSLDSHFYWVRIDKKKKNHLDAWNLQSRLSCYNANKRD